MSIHVGQKAHEACQLSKRISKLAKSLDLINYSNPRVDPEYDPENMPEELIKVIQALEAELFSLIKAQQDQLTSITETLYRML